MSQYTLVENGESEYRLHDPQGNETGDVWDHRPDDVEVITSIGVDRGLPQSEASVFASIISEGYNFRRVGDTDW